MIAEGCCLVGLICCLVFNEAIRLEIRHDAQMRKWRGHRGEHSRFAYRMVA